MRRFWIGATTSVAIFIIVGCESAAKPTSPSAIAPAQTFTVPGVATSGNGAVPVMRTYLLSGVVFEMTASGRRAVEGVELYCDSCGSPVGHTFTTSDARGHYEFEWSMDGRHPLQVWREGYALANPTGSHGGGVEYVTATVNGDTQFDIEVVRR